MQSVTFVGLIGISFVLTACDSDIYTNTGACRDGNSKTECPVGDPPSEGTDK